MTGPLASDGLGYWRGTEFAIDHLNRAGGVLGRQIEVELFDTVDLAPEIVRLAADTLVGEKGYVMVVGGWAGWGQDVEAYGKYDAPFFCYDGSEMSRNAIGADLERNFNVFMATDTEPAFVDEFIWPLMMNLPYDYPNNKIALIGADDAWGRLVVEALRDTALAEGWEVPVYEIVPYGTTEWGGILSKIRAEEPAWLHIEIVSAQDVITFYRQFVAEPTNTLLCYGYSMSPPEFMEIMGEDANGILGTSGGFVGWPPATEEVAAWFEEFEAVYGAPPAAGSPAMYNVVMHWAAAVEAVGSPTDYHAICDWIANTPFAAIPGFRVLNYDEYHSTDDAEWGNGGVQVQDGKWYVLFDLTTFFSEPYVDYQGKSYEFQVPWWIE